MCKRPLEVELLLSRKESDWLNWTEASPRVIMNFLSSLIRPLVHVKINSFRRPCNDELLLALVLKCISSCPRLTINLSGARITNDPSGARVTTNSVSFSCNSQLLLALMYIKLTPSGTDVKVNSFWSSFNNELLLVQKKHVVL